MWDDERKTQFSAQLRSASSSSSSSGWMDAIKSSSSSSSSSSTSSHQRNHINSLSNRINRSSPSINLIVNNSDDDDYTILPPSPPINRTPYSRLKVKARSRSSSRAHFETLDSTSDGPTSMIQERQSTNHLNQLNHNNNNNNYHSDRDFSSFDCYQIDNNRKMVNRSKTLNGSEHNLYHVGANAIRKNRENIYEILTSKKFMDTQKTIGSCSILNGQGRGQGIGNNLIKSQSTQLLTTPTTPPTPITTVNNKQQSTRNIIDQLDSSIIDADNLTNDDLIEKEWNKLVNGTCGNSLIRPITPSTGRKLITTNQSGSFNHNNSLTSLTTIKPPSTSSSSLSLSSLPITTSKTLSTSPTKVNNNHKLNEINHNHNHHHQQQQQQQNHNHNQLDNYYGETNDKRLERKELISEENNRAKLINLFNNMNNQLDHHHHSLTHNYHINQKLNSINYEEKSNITGTRFKEILKLYENLGKCSMFTESTTATAPVPTLTTIPSVTSPTPMEVKVKKVENVETRKLINHDHQSEGINGGGGGGTKVGDCESNVNHQQLKSTILQLDSVCQTRLKTLEECQRKIASLRDDLRSKEEENVSLRADSDLLASQLEEARNGWKLEKDRRLAEGERYKKVTGKLYARLDELNRELQESHINYDYLEMAYNRLKGEVSNLQEVHSAEINLMRDRLNDLTSKLSLSERSLKNAKSYIGKLESRKRRGSSMRTSSRPNSTGSCSVGGNTETLQDDRSIGGGGGGRGRGEGKTGTENGTGNGTGNQVPGKKEKSLTSSKPCIPKDFQHKLQELEVKIARIQVILLANEHQSPDEGLPDIESINSFTSTSFPDHHHHHNHHHNHLNHHQPPSQIIEISPSPPSSLNNNNNNPLDENIKLPSLPVKVETISSTSSSSSNHQLIKVKP